MSNKDLADSNQNSDLFSASEKIVAEKNHRILMQSSARKNLFTTMIYQLIYIGVILAFPYLLYDVVRIDTLQIFTLRINISNVWIFWVVGGILLAFWILELLFLLLLRRIEGTSFGKILGHVVGIYMMIYLPFGTYFGILMLKDIRHPTNEISVEDYNKAGKIPRETYLNAIGSNIMLGAIIRMSFPIIMLLLQQYFITLQVDMIYPYVSAEVFTAWENFCWVYLVLMMVQIGIGFWYPQNAD